MEPYQIDDPCPISTSPMTAALGATNTSLWILGSFSKMFMTVRCLETKKTSYKMVTKQSTINGFAHHRSHKCINALKC